MRASGAGAHGTPFNSYLIGLQRIPNSKVFVGVLGCQTYKFLMTISLVKL